MIRKPRIVTFRLDEATWDRIRKVTHAASATGDRSRSPASTYARPRLIQLACSG